MLIDQPATHTPRYRGIFPVVPTTFAETGELNLASQKRAIDFMIDTDSDGLYILANFSERSSLSDDEREVLTRTALGHVAGRVSVIVTTSHYSTQICTQHSRHAQDMGAAMLMVMPPYHDATFRVSESQIYEFFMRVSDAVGIPIMTQNTPASNTVLSAASLAHMAREIEQVAYSRIEMPSTAAKLWELIRLGGDAIEGPWDGEEAITLLADLDAGATGSMTGGAHPDSIQPIIGAHAKGQYDLALDLYQRWLLLISRGNRQASILAAKALMKEGGVIACEAPRHLLPPMHPDTRRGLVEIARRLDPLVLCRGR